MSEDPNYLSPTIQRLITNYLTGLSSIPTEEIAAIHVDEIASKVAKIYERIRKITDWKEENLLRRNAIERILKRALIAEISSLNFIFKTKVEEVAEPLVLELIRGGHLPNNSVPRAKVNDVLLVLQKYLFLLKNAPFDKISSAFPLKKKINFYNWLLEIAACEIEEILSPPIKENALIEAMTITMFDRINVLPPLNLTDEEKFLQTYVAVHRTLFDLDDAMIAYHLLKYWHPDWRSLSNTRLTEVTGNIFTLLAAIDKELTYALGKEFFSLCERVDTVFTILGDVLEYYKKEPAKIQQTFNDKENLKGLIHRFYQERYATLKSRLFKLAVFSTLSVFVSNWFTFFVVEVPVAHLFYEGFNFLAAAVDFIVPSLAMFILVAMIKPPSKNNEEEVVNLSFRFVYQAKDKDIYEIRTQKRKHLFTAFIISFLYLLGSLVSFGAVAYAFYLATIPISSVVLDTMGIALNVFAALVIRNKSREITVEERASLWEFLLDILSLPVAEIGSWLANKWREYNIIAVFFNVFIEIPFVTFIEFVENWRGFLKEKKASIH